MLLAAVVLLADLARRLAVPHPVVLVLGGLGLGFIPGVPNGSLSPNLVFFVFLPPLVYAAAFLLSPQALAGQARAVGLLATGLVLATMGAIAVAAHLSGALPWGSAFVLGAVLGPTDPVAATAVAQRLGAPTRLSTVLQGEALVNDGTGLALFKVALGAVSVGGFGLGTAVGRLVAISVGGIAVGLATSFVAAQVRKRIDETQLEIATSLVVAYAAYIIADRLGLSGVLASVAAGLYARRASGEMSGPATRVESASFWEVVTFVLESLLFLLIGLHFPSLLHSVRELPVGTVAGYAAAVAGAAIVLRLAWMFTVPYLTGATGERQRDGQTRRGARMPARERLVLGWAGMRGGVSLAAALSIPLAAGGKEFPDRPLVILLTYTTVLATLVVPALTLPAALRALGLAQPERVRTRALKARARLAEAALARAAQLESKPGAALPETAVRRARELYEMRLQRLELGLGDEGGEGDREELDAYRRLRREMLAAERAELGRLRAGRTLGVETIRELERDLDLDEARMRE